MVTHDPNVASFADRVLFLKDGAIVDETRPEPHEAGNAEAVVERMQGIT